MNGYGALNGHAVGIIMKEMVRRVITEIRNQRIAFQIEHKDNPNKAGEDFVTSADRAAQKLYLKTIKECFPGYGIVAEEDNLSVPCTIDGEDMYFTVDPLDGTKAFIRRQSHGIGTMIALVRNGVVIAAAVGDIMTEEIYYFRPDSEQVHRLSEYNVAETLAIYQARPLKSQYLLLREDPQTLSLGARHARKAFKDIEVTGGSIGISFARLWKREVGGMILAPATETPWDFAPVVGISKKMGFRFFDFTGNQPHRHMREVDPPISMNHYRREHETVVIHESSVEEFFSQPSFRQLSLVAG